MEENPIIVEPDNFKDKPEPEPHLIFRMARDIKGMFTIVDKSWAKSPEKDESDEARQTATVSSSPMHYQFRSRDKEKEINPPMRYSNKMLDEAEL